MTCNRGVAPSIPQVEQQIRRGVCSGTVAARVRGDQLVLSSQRSVSMAAMQPEPAAVMAWR